LNILHHNLLKVFLIWSMNEARFLFMFSVQSIGDLRWSDVGTKMIFQSKITMYLQSDESEILLKRKRSEKTLTFTIQ